MTNPTFAPISGRVLLPDGSEPVDGVLRLERNSVDVAGDTVIARVMPPVPLVGAMLPPDFGLNLDTEGNRATFYIAQVQHRVGSRTVTTDLPSFQVLDEGPHTLADLMAADMGDLPGFYRAIMSAEVDAILTDAGASSAAAVAAAQAAEATLLLVTQAAAGGRAFRAATLAQAVTAGLAGTVVGDTFTAAGDDTPDVVVIYSHDAGPIATEIARQPTAERVENEIAERKSLIVTAVGSPADYPLVKTLDGVVVMALDYASNVVDILGAKISLDSVTDDGFTVITADRYEVFHTSDLETRFADLKFRGDPNDRSFKIESNDRVEIFRVDDFTGEISGIPGKNRLTVGRTDYPPGPVPGGLVQDVTKSGGFWQYWLDNAYGSRRVIVKDTGDVAAPHILDVPVIELVEGDGQSWNVRYTQNVAADTIVEEPTGETAARLLAWDEPDVAIFRAGGDVKSTQSDGAEITELFRFRPGVAFTSTQLACAVRAEHRRRFNLPRTMTICLSTGQNGQSPDKFIPEGTSITNGVDTIDAAIAVGQDEFLWARNLRSRSEIANIVANNWLDRTLTYGPISLIEGTNTVPDNVFADFLLVYRREHDLLGLGQRPIFMDQQGVGAERTLAAIGLQNQLDWAQLNATGKDFMFGPRYPFRLGDGLHQSSFGAVEIAEVMGLAMALYERRGAYEPLWITGVAISGTTVTITTNRPHQTVGDLVVDNKLTPQTDHGFSLRTVSPDANIPITAFALSGNTITLTVGSSLAGVNVQVSYAMRGPGRPNGTIANPSHSGCWGSIKMAGRYQSVFVDAAVDQWLCAYRKNHTGV